MISKNEIIKKINRKISIRGLNILFEELKISWKYKIINGRRNLCIEDEEYKKLKEKIDSIENLRSYFQIFVLKRKYGENYKEELDKKTKETKFKKYGSNHFKENAQKAKEATLKKWGTLSTYKMAEIKEGTDEFFKERQKQGVINKLGEDFGKIRTAKAMETKEKKYGDKNYNNPNKTKETLFKRYGVYNGFALTGLYFYDNKYFDSSWEVAYYFYLKENNVDFIYHPTEYRIPYTDMFGKQHTYEPDFLVNGGLIEIKGPQFFDKNGNYINPYNQEYNYLIEEKFNVIKNNNIKILQKEELKPIFNFCKNKKFNPKDYKVKVE